ncbi:MAG: nitroreductase [Pseudomonadota bacterium]
MSLPEKDATRAAVDGAITSRRSIRRFLPTPVPLAVVEDILRVAARSPSGANTQPWQVHVVTGESLQALMEAVARVNDDPVALAAVPPDEYQYYPLAWKSPFIDRRRKVGFALYQLLGIVKGDSAGMKAQHARNFRFFDAPVGLIFTIDRDLNQGSWIDCGMFLQSVMVAARARGLDTCAQAAWIHFHQVIAQQLALDAQQMVVCGMALGSADPDAVENSLVSEREDLAAFATFHG